MSEHPHRHDVWGDDPEERDASAAVAEEKAGNAKGKVLRKSSTRQ